MADTLYVTEHDVAALVDLNDAIDALEEACGRQGRGETLDIPKALGTFGDGSSLHALGSGFLDTGIGGFKTWINTKRGATALMNVFDIDNGRLLAIIEAAILGQLRTSAISGLATRWLADPDASEMALIGTGRQAMLQVAAVAAVRPLQTLRVFSPSADKRAQFVERAGHLFPFDVVECDSLREALAGAPIVTLVTRAREPFVTADMLAEGAHVNAVGAILPGNAEFAQDVFAPARRVVVDSLAGVQKNSREFIDRFGPTGDWSGVETLTDVIAAGRRPTRTGAGLTLFKAMGMGISDLAVAQLVVARARDRGTSLSIAAPTSAAPRWRIEPVAALS